MNKIKIELTAALMVFIVKAQLAPASKMSEVARNCAMNHLKRKLGKKLLDQKPRYKFSMDQAEAWTLVELLWAVEGRSLLRYDSVERAELNQISNQIQQWLSAFTTR